MLVCALLPLLIVVRCLETEGFYNKINLNAEIYVVWVLGNTHFRINWWHCVLITINTVSPGMFVCVLFVRMHNTLLLSGQLGH